MCSWFFYLFSFRAFQVFDLLSEAIYSVLDKALTPLFEKQNAGNIPVYNIQVLEANEDEATIPTV